MSILFLTAMLASPQPAHASPLTPCAPAETTRASIDEIMAGGDAWLGRCVQVRGVTAGRILMAAPGSSSRIGVDNAHALGIGLTGHNEIAVTLVGRIDSCGRRLRQAEAEMARSGDIIMLGGYCHYSSGPVLVASEGSADR